jgi:hypothetical protein
LLSPERAGIHEKKIIPEIKQSRLRAIALQGAIEKSQIESTI